MSLVKPTYRIVIGVKEISYFKTILLFLFFTASQFMFSQTTSKDLASNVVPIDFEYTIYPNPSVDHIIFSTQQVYESLNISIVNANGQTVKVIDLKEKNTVNIDLEVLPNGMYFMTIRDQKKILGIKQFIISK